MDIRWITQREEKSTMKKALVLTLILLIVAIPALAEGWDFASMTTDELIELRNSITDELLSRIGTLNSAHVPAGTYVVGEDIDPGKYVFFWTKEYENRSAISVYSTEEDIENYNPSTYTTIRKVGEEIQIELIEGSYLQIDGSNGVDIRKADKIIVP